MPVSGKKKPTTPNTADSRQGQSVPAVPDQDEFRQHLRELARGAIRVVLEDVMREELDALIGVGWGESSPKRAVGRLGRRAALLAAHHGDGFLLQVEVGFT